jgi:DNA phosphorothioation-dependent restriction protein DptG
MNNFSKKRKQVRRLGFRIYTNRLKAIFLAWLFSRINNEVNWVVKEPEGYMVINTRIFERLNKLKEIGHGKKIRIRDIEKGCMYRSHPKSWGKIKVNPSQKLIVVER